MLTLSLMSNLTSFGAAGLMGALWIWERKLSRRRESQLDEAHGRILHDGERLACLLDAIGANNAAIVKFLQQQKQQTDVLQHLLEDLHHGRFRAERGA